MFPFATFSKRFRCSRYREKRGENYSISFIYLIQEASKQAAGREASIHPHPLRHILLYLRSRPARIRFLLSTFLIGAPVLDYIFIHVGLRWCAHRWKSWPDDDVFKKISTAGGSERENIRFG